MRKLGVLFLVFTGAILFITSCTNTFTVISDYDRTASFESYHTYNYIPGSDSLMGPGASRLKSLTEEYLHLLGYKKSETPDLFVSIIGQVKQKVGYNSSTPGYGGYRGYYGGSYGYGGWDSYTTSYVYNQTTIMIDLVDARQKKLVWQGGATGEFDQYSLKDSKLAKMVDDIFAQYPYTASSKVERVKLYGKYYAKPKGE
ncbi:MAG: hypothetical protein ACI85Q_001340 [Salibacteraceae bacterium]|jgi:hypothetical protein